MMPAASTKADKKTSPEVDDAIKQVLIVMDKKVRNLEKRKSKLDGYKEKAENGAKLEKDQQVAIDRYGEVLQNLEFARELQKHFMTINADNEKFLKKHAKREKIERQAQDTKKLKSVLSIQNLLTDMGSETVRSDFQTGKHGAVVLTEENLNQLDELYKLISPTRDAESDYQTALNEASDHLYNLIEAREKEVVGTTYKDLKEMIDLIDGCGYFENAPYSEETPAEEAATNSHEFAIADTAEVPEQESELVQASVPPEMPMEPEIPTQMQPAQEMTSQQEVSQGTMGDIVAAEADSFFSAPTAPQSVATAEQQQQQAFQRQRPFQEIVSSVQGSFNFLQESTIDMESPHMDPAVVAAHPMPTAPHARPPSTRTPDSTSLSQSGFGAAGFGDQTQTSLDTDASVNVNAVADQTSLRTQSQNVSSVPQDYSNAAFGQTSLSQSLQNDNSLFSSTVEDQTSNISHSVLGQTVSDTTISQFEIPPSIPMPPSHEQSQENQSHQSQPEKKQFTMNPNAGEFQSLLYSQNSTSPDDTAKTDLALSNDVNQTSFQGGFGSDNFQQSQQSQQHQQNSQQRGGRGGGGYRGNNRGNRGGGGGMTNGFSRGGNRGGYGGGSYQGYPPRNDYRPDSYQGYGGGFNSGGFKRGGDGNRGGSRGSNRGGMRGGYSRGGGAPRGGRGGNTGGGFGRPNFNQQQPIAQQ